MHSSLLISTLWVLAAIPPVIGQSNSNQAPVQFDGASAICRAQVSADSKSAALRQARQEALSMAARTRTSSVRYVAYLHTTNDDEASGQEVVVAAEASFKGAQWSEETRTLADGRIEASVELTIAREQIDPTWRIDQIQEEFTGDELLAQLRQFRITVHSWNDPGAEDHVLNVLLEVSDPPDAEIVMLAVDLKERLGEWNSAFNLANTYVDKVEGDGRKVLQRTLDRYRTAQDDLLPKLEDLDEYMALEGIDVVHLAELIEDRWVKASEFERVAIKTFDGLDAPWIIVYRHHRTGLEFTLVPASKGAGVFFPALVARSECSEGAFDALDKPAAARAGLMPKSRVSGQEALKWCEALSFDLPTSQQWQYYCEAGGLSTRTAPTANLGSGQLRPISSGLDGGNAFGLQDMLGNAAEWCRPSGDEERWPLAGGSYKDGSASAETRKNVDSGWSRKQYGFRPIFRIDS